MSEKRKDGKGRLLKTGESQRKDGSYEYKYLDYDGERKTVYSWRLVETDTTPQGKRDKPALREQEEEIERKLDRGYNIWNSKITLSQCVDKYLKTKNFANSTTENYWFYFRKDIKDSKFGHSRVIDLCKSDVRAFYAEKSREGYSNGT